MLALKTIHAVLVLMVMFTAVNSCSSHEPSRSDLSQTAAGHRWKAVGAEWKYLRTLNWAQAQGQCAAFGRIPTTAEFSYAFQRRAFSEIRSDLNVYGITWALRNGQPKFVDLHTGQFNLPNKPDRRLPVVAICIKGKLRGFGGERPEEKPKRQARCCLAAEHCSVPRIGSSTVRNCGNHCGCIDYDAGTKKSKINDLQSEANSASYRRCLNHSIGLNSRYPSQRSSCQKLSGNRCYTSEANAKGNFYGSPAYRRCS